MFDLSIVLPTLGRKTEVDSMLNSIFESNVDDEYKIEIIIVDQNFSDLLDAVIEKYINRSYTIHHYKVSFRGLSKAKNFGTKHAAGKYICYIDDDAEFLPGTINEAIKDLESGMVDVVSGRCVDREGNDSVQKFANQSSFLTINSFEGKFIESTMFFRAELCPLYQYDEEMGVGCFYGAEEGYDVVYRMLKDNVRIKYNPEIRFYHPHTIVSHQGKSVVRRAFTYRCGFGHLCKKNNFKKKYYSRLFKVLFALPVLLLIRPKDVKYYFAELCGLIVGYNF